MKIKQKITTTRDVEMDIELPFYAKTELAYYKIFSEEQCIIFWKRSKSIGIYRATAICDDKYEECTEAEYTEALNEVLDFYKNA